MHLQACIVLVSLIFRQSPSYQLAMNLLVLFVVLVIHMRYLPYLSHTVKIEVVREHERLVLIDPRHARMEAEIKAIVKKNKLDARSKTGMTLDRLLRQRNSTADRLVLQAFDYNTVETTLVSIAIIVNLGGVMLDSNRFATERAREFNKDEYAGLSISVAMLIIGGLIYYAVAFIVDLMTLCPNTAKTVASLCKTKLQSVRTSRNPLSALPRGSLPSAGYVNDSPTSAGAPSVGGGSRGMAVTSRRVSLGSGLSINPFLQHRLANGAKPGAGGDAGEEDDELEDTVQSILALTHPPSGDQWEGVKAAVAGMSVRDVGHDQGTEQEHAHGDGCSGGSQGRSCCRDCASTALGSPLCLLSVRFGHCNGRQ